MPNASSTRFRKPLIGSKAPFRIYNFFFCIFLFAGSLTLAQPSLHDGQAHLFRYRLEKQCGPHLNLTPRLKSVTFQDIADARTLVRDAQIKAAYLNRNRLAHPFLAHTSATSRLLNKSEFNETTTSVPAIYQLSEQVARAAALLAELEAIESPTQNFTRINTLEKRAIQWWMGNKEHRGTYPFGDPDYQVFRNVTDAQWATDGAVRCTPDGKTDCTKAIENAMKAGKRCGAGCNGSTTKQAIIYFPPGAYLISHTIEIYFGTQMIGDALDPPLIVASSSFIGLGIFSSVGNHTGNRGTDPDGSVKEYHTSASNVYRQIRNFQLDLRKAPQTADGSSPMCGIHYQVGQATSLSNIVFMMSQPSHYGVYAENGSGGLISDLVIEGGGYGIYGGSQQFTAQRITFSNVTSAVVFLSDWGSSWKTINVIGGDTGFKLVSADGKRGIGSIMILDSTFSGTKTAIQTLPASNKPKTGTTGITLENVLFESVGRGVIDTIGKEYLPGGSKSIKYWILGPAYFSQATNYRNYTLGLSDDDIKRSDNMTSPINSRPITA
ncbi:hypothetical protein TWF694_007783 [Orbilia ellipsospora]|uniref:Rhamnogalacturonase A/B/Epimerase-like pectate lyase domain-containing protein n=1 Tax=Orbilia ellipsospora TaxID=2528407 RepID=A0AAV9XIV5_9PEZI